MAITNAQQYQQLVNKPANGKRPGYRGEAAAKSDKEAGRSAGRDTSSAGTSNVGGDFDRDSFQAAERMGEARQIAKNIAEDKAEEKVERFRNKQFKGSNLPGLFGLATNLFKRPFQKGMTVNRNFFLDKVLGTGNLNITPEEFANLSLSEQEDLYDDYMSNRLSGETDAYGNRIMKQDDRGSDPIIPMMAQEEDEETPEDPRQVLSTRILGSQFDPTFFAADGGIMNADIVGGFADGSMDEMGRQMYGLGKLVKKATRAVKKIVKSPVGKAAILGGMAYFGGGGGLPKFLGGKGLGGFSAKTLFSSKNPLLFTDGKLSFAKTMGLSAVLPLLAGQSDEEKDKFLQDYYAQKLEPGTTKRQMGSEFDFYNYNLADGGRIGLKDGLLALPMKKDGFFISPDFENMTEEQKIYMEGMKLQEKKRQEKIKKIIENMQKSRPENERFLKPVPMPTYGPDGKRSFAEGGDVEPVAKKTMPLIDMGGKEKDYRETGGFVDMGRMERADDVPARLSKNEFVFTADAVRNAGDGDIDKGAEVMYNMMKNLESGGDVSEESQGLEGARNMFQTSQRLGEVL